MGTKESGSESVGSRKSMGVRVCVSEGEHVGARECRGAREREFVGARESVGAKERERKRECGSEGKYVGARECVGARVRERERERVWERVCGRIEFEGARECV